MILCALIIVCLCFKRAEKEAKLKEKESTREIQKEKLKSVSANVCITRSLILMSPSWTCCTFAFSLSEIIIMSIFVISLKVPLSFNFVIFS